LGLDDALVSNRKDCPMPKPRKGWVYSPKSLPKPKVSDDLKAEVLSKANELVEEFLKPNFIKKPPKKWRWNYIIDIHAQWQRSCFYFIATFRSPGPRANTPTFEAPFTRLEYVADHRFNMAYMRYTGKWWEVHQRLSLEECLKAIKEEGIFQPVKI
jgi:hypothetical protein